MKKNSGIHVLLFSAALFLVTSFSSQGDSSTKTSPPLDPHAKLSPPPAASSPPPLPRPGDSKLKSPVLNPGAAGTARSETKPISAPAPHAAAELPSPPVGAHAVPTAPRSAADLQQVTPVVEVWRANAHTPQIPPRKKRYVAEAYVVDSRPVLVRLQFDPAARGNSVVVRPGQGVVLDAATEHLRINGAGECLVTLHLAEDSNHGHVAFHCAGLMTTVSLTRAPEARVQSYENLSEGGRP